MTLPMFLAALAAAFTLGFGVGVFVAFCLRADDGSSDPTDLPSNYR